MPRYQVLVIERPEGWEPATPDDAPAAPGKPLEVVSDSEDLFSAVRKAIEFNQAAQEAGNRRWAVVVEPGTVGKTWRNARLCTPLSYKVTAIWWPSGWEPNSPLDVPDCVWKSQGETADQRLSYQQALATVRGLNQQSMDHASAMWYVIVAVENEPLSQSVSFDASGTETRVDVRRLHLVGAEAGGGRGDCSHCPAHSLPCAREDWISLEQTQATTHTQSL
jgi:hypothetical protein